jgi:hypothetical protein
MAPKLWVVIGHGLSKRRLDRQADPERVVRYCLAWGRQARVFSRTGLTAAPFARQQLDMLGIGQELSQITSGAAYRLPPSSLPVTEATTRPA